MRTIILIFFMLILLGVAVAMGVAAAVVITRSLLRQLGAEPGYTAKIATSIAHGDLAVAIDTDYAVAGSLLVEMKNMRGSLVDIVGQVRAAGHLLVRKGSASERLDQVVHSRIDDGDRLAGPPDARVIDLVAVNQDLRSLRYRLERSRLSVQIHPRDVRMAR